MNNNFYLYVYASLIILVKLIFLLFIMICYYYKLKNKQDPNNPVYKKNLAINTNIKNQLELSYTFLMSILMIILFNPMNKHFVIDSNMKMLLFIFGFVTLFTMDWSNFIANE